MMIAIIAIGVVALIVMMIIYSELRDILHELCIIRRFIDKIIRRLDRKDIGIFSELENLDIESLHPNIIAETKEFGEDHTDKFKKLVDLEKRVTELESKMNDIYIEE